MNQKLLEQLKMDDELRKLESDIPSIKNLRRNIERAETRQLVLIARECMNEEIPELQEFAFKLLMMECKKRQAEGDDFAGQLLTLLIVITRVETDEEDRQLGIRMLFGKE